MNLKETILENIKSGEVQMTPRVRITLKWVALGAVALLAFIVSAMIFHFIAFSIRLNSHDGLLDFGPRGFYAFFSHFPWLLLLVDIALLFLLQSLIRRFRFGYHIPILYVAGAILAGALVTGMVFDQIMARKFLADRDRLPRGVKGIYDGFGKGPQRGSGMCKCEILAIKGNTLIVEDVRAGTTSLTVILPEHDSYATTSGLKVGDIVFIAGEEEGDVIRAFGVRKKGEGKRPPPRDGMAPPPNYR